jgi:hypothetical protein
MSQSAIICVTPHLATLSLHYANGANIEPKYIRNRRQGVEPRVSSNPIWRVARLFPL